MSFQDDDWRPLVREWSAARPTRPAPGDTVVVTTERERPLLLGVLDTLGIQGVTVVVTPRPGGWLRPPDMTSATGGPSLPTLLLAEDEPHTRALVRLSIDFGEQTLIEAADGETAWGLVRVWCPAVVLANVCMPGKDGLELARAIKADPALAGTHVILLSARADPSDVRAGLGAGADQYLTKPFSPLKLLAAIARGLHCSPPAPPPGPPA